MSQLTSYGWIRDLPDHRDRLYATTPKTLPTAVDLRNECPPVYSQGPLGSCTSNAIAAAIQFERIKQNLIPVFNPSRLFIYYNTRALQNTILSDSGASIRLAIQTVVNQGDCPEDIWPYLIEKFKEKPKRRCYKEASKYQVIQYQRVIQDINLMKGCIAEGFPFVFGFTVYTSFETAEVAKTGIMQMPTTTDKVKGGHAVLAVGYDDTQQRFLVRNSWGEGWGIKGYFWMPYSYIANPQLCNDLWTIRLTETGPPLTKPQLSRETASK
jgi:C1A family cysteine protease